MCQVFFDCNPSNATLSEALDIIMTRQWKGIIISSFNQKSNFEKNICANKYIKICAPSTSRCDKIG